MAGDWSKMEHALRDKPEVIAMSLSLKIERDLIVGKLHRAWTWFDQHTVDGNAPGVTPAFLNEHVALDGFASALESVGWLSIRNNGISMPNFDRHCSKSAKGRALTNSRVKRSRNAPTVTKPLPEKRREEKSIKPHKAPFVQPTVSQVQAYCEERRNGISGQEFVDSYARIGWVVGKNKTPMRDWQAAVRTWEQNRERGKQPIKQKMPTPEEDAAWTP